MPLHEPFETALRGFNRQQVLDHIESLEGRISMIETDRELALAQVAELSRTLDHLREESKLLAHLRQTAEQVKEQMEHIQQSPIVGASVRIQRIMQLAEEEAAELKARAEREVADLKARTEQELAERRRRTAGEADALLRDAAQRCKVAEQAAVQEITRRESEATARIQRRDQGAIAGLYLMMKIVGRQLAERICVVEQEENRLAELCVQNSHQVSALEDLRTKITAQLITTRQALAQTLDQLRRTASEPAELPQPVPIQRGGRAAAEQTTGRATG